MSANGNGVPAAKRQKLDIPKGLEEEHPAVILRFRPEGKTALPKQLEYYCLQGLGEIQRLLCEATQTPYDSIMHFTNTFKEYAPFGQLPLYRGDEIAGAVIAQSGSICRHLAKMTGTDGSGPTEQAQVDSLYELAKDISGTREAVHDPKSASTGQFVMYMKAAEKCAPSSGDGYWVGKGLTLADVAMFDILYKLLEMKAGCLDSYPKLKAFTDGFAKRPAISAYLASDRRIPLTLKEGRFPYEGHGYTYTKPLSPAVVAELYSP